MRQQTRLQKDVNKQNTPPPLRTQSLSFALSFTTIKWWTWVGTSQVLWNCVLLLKNAFFLWRTSMSAHFCLFVKHFQLSCRDQKQHRLLTSITAASHTVTADQKMQKHHILFYNVSL